MPIRILPYVADIGDNSAHRRQITIYRVPERSGHRARAVTGIFHATYPDHAHDLEALLVTRRRGSIS